MKSFFWIYVLNFLGASVLGMLGAAGTLAASLKVVLLDKSLVSKAKTTKRVGMRIANDIGRFQLGITGVNPLCFCLKTGYFWYWFIIIFPTVATGGGLNPEFSDTRIG